MKRIEISYRANVKELEKLEAKLERAKRALEKRRADAEKLGVATWTQEQYRAWMDTVETQNGFIVKKEDVKINGAWFELFSAEHELVRVEEEIENANRRFAKTEKALNDYIEKLNLIEDLKKKEELIKAEFEEEKKEWAKDGIKLNGRYYGRTPHGKPFYIDRNNGFTERSLHCYTLYINGETIFTSGEFWRAYGIIKRS